MAEGRWLGRGKLEDMEWERWEGPIFDFPWWWCDYLFVCVRCVDILVWVQVWLLIGCCLVFLGHQVLNPETCPNKFWSFQCGAWLVHLSVVCPLTPGADCCTVEDLWEIGLSSLPSWSRFESLCWLEYLLCGIDVIRKCLGNVQGQWFEYSWISFCLFVYFYSILKKCNIINSCLY